MLETSLYSDFLVSIQKAGGNSFPFFPNNLEIPEHGNMKICDYLERCCFPGIARMFLRSVHHYFMLKNAVMMGFLQGWVNKVKVIHFIFSVLEAQRKA